MPVCHTVGLHKPTMQQIVHIKLLSLLCGAAQAADAKGQVYKDEVAYLEEVMTYFAACFGKDDYITRKFIKFIKFIKQVTEKKKAVEQMVRLK